jgi:Mn-dependent DtxR family transcriptional regulator
MANRPVSAVRSATRILRAFSIAEPELGVAELARRLGVSKAGVHHLLATLVDERMIERDPVSRRRERAGGSRAAPTGEARRTPLREGQAMLTPPWPAHTMVTEAL